MSNDETRFHHLADQTLDRLTSQIDEALGDDLDVDEQDKIVTIGLPSGGQYIVSKNAPVRQIWLSSPASGAWHFAWDEASSRWVSTRGSEVLTELLAAELAAVVGRPFELT